MDGIKKTALFLSGLDYTTVDQLLGRLDADSARRVRREMMSLHSDGVSEQESFRLDNEFLQKAGRKPQRHVPKTEFQLANPPTVTYQPPKRKSVRFDIESFIPKIHPFDFLRQWETEDIVREIAEEHPQTIAVVLAYLPRSRAGKVLASLPPTLKKNVAERLAYFIPPREDLIHEIETTLKNRIKNKKQNAGHFSKQQHFTFENIESLNDSDLATLFHSVDAVTAMFSLIGAEPSLIERVTKRFSPTEEYQMRQLLKQIEKINEDDIFRARTAITEKAVLLMS
jgi:flagellar motor switch protein FliG